MLVGELLEAALRATGVSGVYGGALQGVRRPVDVSDPELAALLALADERVHGSPAVLHRGDQVLTFGPGDVATHFTVERPADLAAVVAEAVTRREMAPGETVAVHVELDLGAPASDVAAPLPRPWSPWVDVDPGVVDALAAAESLVFLVGPGVLRDRAEDGLRSLAASTSAGVLNTWGAKGVFYWQSRHHLATIGLQSDDFVLSGLGDAALIVTSGLDDREAPRARWDLAPASLDVAARMLAPLAEADGVTRPRREIPFPPIRTRLGAVTARGWETTGPRPAPTALTRRYSQAVGPSGLVAADPGTAGFFVARTLPTEAARAVVVPAEGGVEGFAVAAAIVAQRRSPGRRCLAVVDGPLGPRAAALLDVAAALDVGVVVDAWSDDGPALDADEHLAAVAGALASRSVVVRPVAVGLAQLDEFVAAAGDIVAWRDPAGPEEVG